MRIFRSRRWAAAGLVVLGLAASACGVKAPILAVDGVKMGDVGITGAALDVRFRVRNPNPEPLNIDRMEYELFVNGNRLGRGFESKGLALEGFGEGKVESRVDVNFLALPGAVKDVLRQDRVKARVKGHFYTSGSYGTKRLGFDADADVDLGGR
ncbi:MAG TPA: LEA type 2 family protein [Vicinamibacteria bacterium]